MEFKSKIRITNTLCVETRIEAGVACAVNGALKRILIATLTLAWLAMIPLNAWAQTGSDAQKALSKKPYPWYDAESDSFRPLEFQERPAARSINRDSIPVKDPKVTKTNTNNANFNPGAGGNWQNWNMGGALLGGLSALTWAAIIIFVLILIGVLIWAIIRMGSNQETLEDDERPKRTMEESIKQLPFELEAPKGDFRSLAQSAYASGDYRKAITYLFSHILVSLDQKGLIRLRKGKTNRQYLRELRPHRPLANYYQHVMVPFEAAFFGDHELEKSEFDLCWNQLEQFQAGVSKTRQVGNV